MGYIWIHAVWFLGFTSWSIQKSRHRWFGGLPQAHFWKKIQQYWLVIFFQLKKMNILNISQMLHVWNIYLHLPQKWHSHVGKYSSIIEHLGANCVCYLYVLKLWPEYCIQTLLFLSSLQLKNRPLFESCEYHSVAVSTMIYIWEIWLWYGNWYG